MSSNGAPVPLIDEVMDVVAASFPHITLADFRSANRARKFARPRQVAMRLARELTAQSYPKIGRRFGGRDHTTALYAFRRVEQLCLADPNLDVIVERARSAIARLIVDDAGMRLPPTALRRLFAAARAIGAFCVSLRSVPLLFALRGDRLDGGHSVSNRKAAGSIPASPLHAEIRIYGNR